MKIANIMSRNVRIVEPDQTLREAAGTMKKLDAGALGHSPRSVFRNQFMKP